MQDAYDEKWVAKVRSKCVVDENGCWLWQGFIGHWGYGMICYRGKQQGTHRAMLSLKIGRPLSKGEQALHTCDIRHCCNPDHLWLGNHALNQRDKAIKGRVNYSAAHYTHCKHGHEFTPENTRITKNGFRHCRACARRIQRIRAGWPIDLAKSMDAQPKGTRPINARWALARRVSP